MTQHYNVSIDYANDKISNSNVDEISNIFKNDLKNILDVEEMSKLSFSVVNLNGPAGGWPEINLSGEEIVLNKILDSFGYNSDQDYLKEFGTEI